MQADATVHIHFCQLLLTISQTCLDNGPGSCSILSKQLNNYTVTIHQSSIIHQSSTSHRHTCTIHSILVLFIAYLHYS